MNNKETLKINKTPTEFNTSNVPVHNSPANKEWVNNFYAYNKNYEKTTIAKDKIANNLLKTYFSMSTKKLRKSKRMSDFLRKSTIKQFYVSKLETKQTSDKAVLTGYILDRHRYYLSKKTFSFLRALKKNGSNISLNKNKTIPKLNSIFLNKKYMNYDIINNRFNKYINKSLNLKKNKQFSEFTKFHFLMWALSIFNLNVTINNKYIKLEKLDDNINENLTVWKIIEEFLKKRNSLISKRKKHYNMLNKRGQKRRKKNEYTLKKHLYENNRNKYLFIGNKLNYNNLFIINSKLLNILNLKMKKSENSLYRRNLRLNELFTYFSQKYITNFNIIMNNIFKDKYMLTRNLIKKWIFTKNKIKGFLPFLKYLMYKIYGKKIEFNIVNIKYLQLTGDNLLKAISIKLKRRKVTYMKIIRKSLDLFNISIDYKDSYIKETDIFFQKKNINEFSGLASYRGYTIFIENKDVAKEYLHGIFGNENKTSVKENQIMDNINLEMDNIKYKKFTGIKIEVNGRLTKRFTASRAQHKTRVKGSLENFDHLKHRIKQYQKPSSITLRGNIKPNIQYNIINSKRRIGSFGIRSWISSN